MWDPVLMGFSVALMPANLFYCFSGVFLGTLIGVLPGIGPAATVGLLVPLTLHLSPTAAIIMLAGICYGAQYGGSTTAILLNIPGESTAVMTTLDGYQMARQGRAGPALGMSAFGSFIGGTVGVIGLMSFGPPLTDFALKFGPPEYCSLILFALLLVGYFGGGSLLRSLLVTTVGLFLGTVGQDMETMIPRFTFGVTEFLDGIDIIPVIMGLFGVTEVLCNLEQIQTASVFSGKIGRLLPLWKDWKDSLGPVFRGSALGFFLGTIPGAGATLSTFMSYAIEKRISKHPEKFGHGAIEGVAGPETANNAATQGNFLPLLCLGLPTNGAMAIILGALLIHGVKVGPLLLQNHPDLFWGVTTSMYVGNIMLLVLNIPLIPLWVRLLKVPYHLLFPLILFLCMIGVYSINNSLFDIGVMIGFGVIGYFMRKYQYEPVSLVLGMILAPILETAFRQTMIISKGSFGIFFTRPISAVFLIVALGTLTSPVLVRVFRRSARSSSGP